MTPRSVGVLIGRFQIHTLTEGHKYLFAQVAGRCTRVLALLGVPPVIGQRRDPLEYSLRARMLQDYWADAYRDGPELTVLPSIDCQTDEEWARRADQMIDAVAPNTAATVFCGPDGCGPTYAKAGGRHTVEVIESIPGHHHATVMRANLQPRHTEDFRAGVVYHSQRGFLNPFPVVDIIIRDGESIVLAQKATETARWRLIGGFVDVGDESLEAAARREVMEETGLEVGPLHYVTSLVIPDWRYRSGPETMLSTCFVADRLWGTLVAKDDIARTKRFQMADVASVIHPHHAEFWSRAQWLISQLAAKDLKKETAWPMQDLKKEPV